MSSHSGSRCPLHLWAADRSANPQSMAGGLAAVAYGMLCYAAFLATILYAIGFVGNWIVPKSIDSGAAGPVLPSLAVNGALLMIFVLQHTIMARPRFKRAWARVLPPAIERSTFVLLASASLAVLFAWWRPLPQPIWSVSDPIAAGALTALSLLGWVAVPAASFVINHFDLFGVRQVWLRFLGRPYTPVHFRVVGPYRFVRHPLMLGFLVAFWSTPTMSLGHLFFAVMTTGYILFGTWMEERDLAAEHGERYLEYRRRVPALIPFTRPARQAPRDAAADLLSSQDRVTSVG
jgi:protein-S-isoprenylcysteine O-methyltransferase Ste14